MVETVSSSKEVVFLEKLHTSECTATKRAMCIGGGLVTVSSVFWGLTRVGAGAGAEDLNGVCLSREFPWSGRQWKEVFRFMMAADCPLTPGQQWVLPLAQWLTSGEPEGCSKSHPERRHCTCSWEADSQSEIRRMCPCVALLVGASLSRQPAPFFLNKTIFVSSDF